MNHQPACSIYHCDHSRWSGISNFTHLWYQSASADKNNNIHCRPLDNTYILQVNLRQCNAPLANVQGNCKGDVQLCYGHTHDWLINHGHYFILASMKQMNKLEVAVCNEDKVPSSQIQCTSCYHCVICNH